MTPASIRFAGGRACTLLTIFRPQPKIWTRRGGRRRPDRNVAHVVAHQRQIAFAVALRKMVAQNPATLVMLDVRQLKVADYVREIRTDGFGARWSSTKSSPQYHDHGHGVAVPINGACWNFGFHHPLNSGPTTDEELALRGTMVTLPVGQASIR
jgi:hypothetical protein